MPCTCWHDGVEAQVEVGGVDEPAPLAPRRSRSADSAGVMASGFSHTTCLPAREGGLRVLVMKVIRRGDVDDVDARVVEHRLEALVGRRQADLLGARRGALVARTDDAVHLDAQPPQRLDVDGADEAGADDGGADLAE